MRLISPEMMIATAKSASSSTQRIKLKIQTCRVKKVNKKDILIDALFLTINDIRDKGVLLYRNHRQNEFHPVNSVFARARFHRSTEKLPRCMSSSIGKSPKNVAGCRTLNPDTRVAGCSMGKG